ncbi:MAG: DUF4114 domain-containing protein [Armatimonadetes bacterium]|nr:DUF4114 domain-containing protein [Armatimonadota bacterium]
MGASNILIRSLALGSALGVIGAANAILIDPAKLQTSSDGGGLDVQSLLIAKGFTGSSVGTSIPDYGDQVDFETYGLTQSDAIWQIKWQNAGFANKHRLGYYTNIGDAVINASDITWVLGDLDDNGSTDLVTTSAPININTTFGLAFYAGDGAGTIFYSQTFRNPDSNPTVKDHAATINALPVPSGYATGVVVSWEDSLNNVIDKDYNDLGVFIGGARAVPEPATMATLALGAAALLRRRKSAKK